MEDYYLDVMVAFMLKIDGIKYQASSAWINDFVFVHQ